MSVLQRLWKIGWLRWQPTRDTWVAFGVGLAVIALSTLLLLGRDTSREGVAFFALRDLAMVFGFGFVVPVGYTLFVERNPLSELGLTRHRWALNLAVNAVLAVLLALQFTAETPAGASLSMTPVTMGAIFYLMVTGIFEMLFFYGFLQLRFERAFGIIPAIALAAALYSLHHIGFQIPLEADPIGGLVKLFLVGVMYMSVFRISRSLLILYPFFWGVGAGYDLLVTVGAPPETLRWSNALVVLGLMVVTGVYLKKKRKER